MQQDYLITKNTNWLFSNFRVYCTGTRYGSVQKFVTLGAQNNSIIPKVRVQTKVIAFTANITRMCENLKN